MYIIYNYAIYYIKVFTFDTYKFIVFVVVVVIVVAVVSKKKVFILNFIIKLKNCVIHIIFIVKTKKKNMLNYV